MSLHVQPFHHAGTGTWSYIVSDTGTAQAAIIDPVLDFDAATGRASTGSAQALLDEVRERHLDVQWLLETHAHADHLSSAQWLKTQLPQARVAIGHGIRAVQRTLAPTLGLDGMPTDGSQFDHLFHDDDVFRIGTVPARVIAVPGHTRDSLAYLIGDALFTGDSLFLPDAGSARCDFPGGDAGQLYRSIQRLYGLPDATRVFVCHDYGIKDGEHAREPRCATTIGEQKRGNIHLREGVSEAEFVAMRSARDATLAPPALMTPALRANLRAGAIPPAPNGAGR
ncbi:MBL fold metallo-hydrolase [Lysobacter koreensis]|uniref:MBL fold metallo-hydrolase n=1 Tax=Lysobacter koreensis TaxID=266122 RepID=A0ABW2YLS9_9GAMM